MGRWKMPPEPRREQKSAPTLNWRQKSPAFASGPRRMAARKRKGTVRERLLRERCRRGDFSYRELTRRTVQLWASI